jgi:hypothetical protein
MNEMKISHITPQEIIYFQQEIISVIKKDHFQSKKWSLAYKEAKLEFIYYSYHLYDLPYPHNFHQEHE